VDTIGESISLVNTGENLAGKDSLDRAYALCYMQREIHPNMMMGSVSDSSLLQVPVPTSSSRVPVRLTFQFSSSKPWVEALCNYLVVVDKRRSP
jgi:hypothetical protein